MASASDSIPQAQQCYLFSYNLQQQQVEVQTDYIPSHLTQVELIIEFDLLARDYTVSFSSRETLRFGLNVLQDDDQFHQLLAPAFTRLGINISSTSYDRLLEQITSLGVGIAHNRLYNRGVYCKTMCLHAMIQATQAEIEIRYLGRDLDEPESEVESDDYGMVATNESSINEMLMKLRIEEEENCSICFEKLKVGFKATRMPCSHTFHGDCILKWLNQSHYCPICRYEMPTE